MHKSKGFTVLPLLIMIGAVVAFTITAVVIYQANKPSSVSTTTNTAGSTNTTPQANQNANTVTKVNTRANVNAGTNTNTTVESRPSTDTVNPDNRNVHIYTSYKLGIRFSYWSSPGNNANVFEQDDRVYVYKSDLQPTQGQWVEVHSKRTSQTLAEAVTEDFLSGIDPAKCYTRSGGVTGSDYPDGEIVTIDFPHSGGLDDPSWGNRNDCPSEYTVSNAALFFWAESNQSEKYVFFSIGQYFIGGTGEMIPWQNSLELIETTDTTATE